VFETFLKEQSPAKFIRREGGEVENSSRGRESTT
jgi:hypothetical protein